MANNVIVNVPNSISKSRRALKIDEERVLYLSLSRLNLDSDTDYADEDERTVKVSLKEIRELYGGRSYKTRLRDTCKNRARILAINTPSMPMPSHTTNTRLNSPIKNAESMPTVINALLLPSPRNTCDTTS